MTDRFTTADAVVSALRPAEPVMLLRPHASAQAAAAALAAFPGTVAYAVKVCDQPEILAALAAAGIRHWDVASIHEIRTVQSLFRDATLHFMNPVKPREHIAEAYARGVRTFAYDCARELDKIAEATGNDPGILPVLRVAVPNDHAQLPLAGKFGCSPAEAPSLLARAMARGWHPGVTFHVGSQCMKAAVFGTATDIVCRAAATGGIEPAMVDIGGGFPAAYRGNEPSFAACIRAAKTALDRWFPGFRGTFQCEPGRLLAAPGASTLARVELRKGNALYLNDGYYGSLVELKWMPATHPVRLLRVGTPSRAPLAEFSFFGPSCDTVDALDGPYALPADAEEGDWIEVGLMGAYSTVLSTRFNGFTEPRTIVLTPGAALRRAA